MARPEKFSGHQGSGSFNLRVTSEVVQVDEVMLVPVLSADASLFETFITRVYGVIEQQWGYDHPAVPMPVSLEEMLAYSYTALKARLSRVVGTGFHTRCDDDGWRLPAVIAHIINQVGRFTMESPVVTVIPVWDTTFDGNVLTKDAWWKISHRMGSLASDPHLKVVFVRAISGERQGSPDVMALVPVRDELGRIVRVYGSKPVDGLAAAVFFIAGLDPEIYRGFTLSTPVLLLPQRAYKAERGTIVSALEQLYDHVVAAS